MSNIPGDLKYTRTHEWIRTEDHGTVTMGVTYHAQTLLGDLVFVELPAVGQQLKAGDELGVVESVKAAADIYAPVSGEVCEVNPLVNDDPGVVNRDPYGDGWLVKISVDHTEDMKALLDGEQYSQETKEE